MSDLEQTQAIYLEDFGEETDEENEDGKKKIVRIFWGNIVHLIFQNITYFICCEKGKSKWMKSQA